MRKYHLLLLVLIVGFAATAQHTRVFKFEDVGFRLKSKYHHLTVIDQRQDKELGYVKTGAFNRKGLLVMEKDFDLSLSDYFASINTDGQKENDELVLVVYDLKIEEATPAEIGTFCFSGAFFAGNKGRYTPVAEVDTFFEMTDPIDVTHKLVHEVVNFFDDVFSKVATESAFDDRLPVFDIAKVKEWKRERRKRYPAYQATSFTRGIYRTVDDFLNNTPFDTPLVVEYAVANGSKRFFYYCEKSNGKKGEKLDETTFFAIYDGEEWAVSDRKYCKAMSYVEGEFIAQQTREGMLGYGSPVAGLIGGLLSLSAKNILYECWFDPAIKCFRPRRRIKPGN